ncbi:MAG: hypothetical protein FJ303_12615 [Planctomycetes bacterium]|nr:hypothetical protein [Planctomycetota bacterium]
MLASLAVAGFLFTASPQATNPNSYLFHMQTGADGKVHLVGKRYQPQSGDLILFDDHNPVTAKIYSCCGTGRPLHAGIIFLKDDGSPAVLEAGTNAVMKVFVFDFHSRLKNFDGTILIRQLRTPLSVEREKALRDFAWGQEGKGYALGRAILHASPFRAREPVYTAPFGRTVLDRDRWICSELAVAAATSAGILNPATHPANLMLPRDLCYDERYDLSKMYESPALWSPRAKLDEVDGGVRVGPR